MRTPTTAAERWAWWEAAVAGLKPPVYEDEPQAGFYAVRKFRYGEWTQGPMLPARIIWRPGEIDPETGELLSPEQCRADVNGAPVDPWRTWLWLARRPIPENEWEWLTAIAPLLPSKIPPKPKRR